MGMDNYRQYNRKKMTQNIWLIVSVEFLVMKRPNYRVINIENDIIKTFSQSMERQNKPFRYGAITILIILELRTPKLSLNLAF